MSSDFIKPIGARSTPQLNPAGSVAPQRAVSEAPKAETSNNVAAQAPTEGFSPTSEAKETDTENKAGEAKASEILGAWSNGASSEAGTNAISGQLSVDGAKNTNVNQVHGVSDGAYQASNGAKPGFTGATVYSSKPPTT